jgi:pimeloyl-ACP methyl ester carboxylesterase
MKDHDTDDLALLDRPEVVSFIFCPRREFAETSATGQAMPIFIPVDEEVSIGCRFYPTCQDDPVIFYFHGNGEIASDYDYVAPFYNAIGVNLFVVDYRGYGMSNGTPTATALVKDAHALFHRGIAVFEELGYTGNIIVMGRSLGSIPALELAAHHQNFLAGLIIESGFSNTMSLIECLGFGALFEGVKNFRGFGNGDKIKTVSLPTLIIHAEQDMLIPVSEGRQLYHFSGSIRKKIVIIPDAGHNDIMASGVERYFAEIESFIKMVSG